MTTTPTPRGAYPGHAVLQISAPPLEPWVRARSLHYDPAYVSADPRFSHAHLTALGPIPDVVDGVLPASVEALIAAVCRATSPWEATLNAVDTFPTGIIHLRPEDPAPFSALTAALREALPHVSPYGGRFVPDPHLTLDALAESVSEKSTRAAVEHLLPATFTVSHLDLAWWAPQECRLLAQWELGTSKQAHTQASRRLGSPLPSSQKPSSQKRTM